jgi:hypothetical protein
MVVWDQAVLNGLGTTPQSVASLAALTTDTLYSTLTLIPSLVLSPVSMTDTPYSTLTHSAIPA